MEKRNIEETKQKYEELLKRIREAQKTQYANNKSGATEEETKAYFLACIDEREEKKELTKARKEFAEAIMFNFEETDNNPYQEKLEAKKERFEELAEKNRREKISNNFEKSIELSHKADYYEKKAQNFGSFSISADDRNAILKLKEKYINVKGMYASAERRRIIDRVIDIYKRLIEPTKPAEEQGNGFTICRNTEINRIQILFDEIPNEETRKLLKTYGFRWSPFNKAWQRQLNGNGEWAVKTIKEKLA